MYVCARARVCIQDGRVPEYYAERRQKPVALMAIQKWRVEQRNLVSERECVCVRERLLQFITQLTPPCWLNFWILRTCYKPARTLTLENLRLPLTPPPSRPVFSCPETLQENITLCECRRGVRQKCAQSRFGADPVSQVMYRIGTC